MIMGVDADGVSGDDAEVVSADDEQVIIMSMMRLG